VAQRPDTNVLRIDPSLTIDRRDIERFLETLENVLIDIGSAGS
jgi:4-aminobutyrate aminotransferase-like enzyme